MAKYSCGSCRASWNYEADRCPKCNAGLVYSKGGLPMPGLHTILTLAALVGFGYLALTYGPGLKSQMDEVMDQADPSRPREQHEYQGSTQPKAEPATEPAPKPEPKPAPEPEKTKPKTSGGIPILNADEQRDTLGGGPGGSGSSGSGERAPAPKQRPAGPAPVVAAKAGAKVDEERYMVSGRVINEGLETATGLKLKVVFHIRFLDGTETDVEVPIADAPTELAAGAETRYKVFWEDPQAKFISSFDVVAEHDGE